MTERERWIVYPLLFLALGAALRDKLVHQTTTKSLVCQELLIVDEESSNPQSQRTLARIGRSEPLPGGPATGLVVVHGNLVIDGAVEANQYFWQNVPILTMQVAPGLVFPGMLPVVPKQGQQVPNSNAPTTQPPAKPPATNSTKSPSTPPPSSPADDQSAPAK